MRLIDHDRGDDDAVVGQRLRRLFGTKTGLINDIRHIPPDRGRPDVTVATPEVADVGRLTGSEADLDLGVAGKGRTIRAAYLRALGEGIERYCLCWPDPDRMRRTTHDALSAEADTAVVDRSLLDVYADRDDSDLLAPFDAETEIPWTTGTDLSSGESVAVPSEQVWLRTGPLADDPVRFPGSSNGAATGQSYPAALSRAALELVERDAFMRHWCRQASPPSVDLDRFPEARAFRDRVFGDAGPEISLLALDSPLDVPVVAAVATEFPGGSSFLVSASAGFDPAEAMVDSLLEIAQGIGHLYELDLEYDAGEIDVTAVLDDLERNVAYYADPDHFDEVAFLLEGPDEAVDVFPDAPSPDGDREALAALTDRFDAADATPIAFDVTTPDVGDVGLRVVRVVAPELVPLSPPACLPRSHPAFDGETVTEKPHPFP